MKMLLPSAAIAANCRKWNQAFSITNNVQNCTQLTMPLVRWRGRTLEDRNILLIQCRIGWGYSLHSRQ